MFLILYAGTLNIWFGELYLLLLLQHHLLVDLGDDAWWGGPVVALNVAFLFNSRFIQTVLQTILSSMYTLFSLLYVFLIIKYTFVSRL